MAMAPADAPAAKSTVLLGTSRESGKARDDEVEAGRRDVEPQARAGCEWEWEWKVLGARIQNRSNFHENWRNRSRLFLLVLIN
jgi:hypothetical protein